MTAEPQGLQCEAMCTVSIIPTRARAGALSRSCVRLACNRDESRLRPPALPPRTGVFGNHRAVLPIDPVSEGTWVATNDAGLAMTLMNTYPVPFDREFFLANAGRYRSRGALIPSLLRCATLEEAFDRARVLESTAYPDFRLLILDRERFVEICTAGDRLTVSQPRPIDTPVMYASSGLGDALVTEPRQRLFDQLFTDDDWTAVQDAFHRHRWPDRPHLSVCMSRPEARTVSLTIVEIRPEAVRMVYYPEAPDLQPEPVTVELPISPAAGAAAVMER